MVNLEALIARYWWTLVVRGVAAMLFGALTFFWPGPTLAALALLFGVYALVDGVAGVAAGVRQIGERERWWAPLVAGVISIAAGVITFVTPGVTMVVLLFIIAVWAVVRGVFDMAAAIRLRRVIEGEWLLALGGAMSIAFGVLLFAFPLTGALIIAWWIAAYAFVFGALLVAGGFRLRNLARATAA